MIEIKKVCDGVYRSAYPDIYALEYARTKHGIENVLNLQNRNDEFELGNCIELGLRLFDLDWNGLFPPYEETLELTSKIISSYQPILVHCWAGRERTGLAIAHYKILCGMAPQLAYDEMIANGCRWPNSWLYKKRLGL